MSCQHNFIRDVRTFEPFWICDKCELEMSVDHYQAYQQARKEGWEQAKAEAIGEITKLSRCNSQMWESILITEQATDAIASMTYKEAQDENEI